MTYHMQKVKMQGYLSELRLKLRGKPKTVEDPKQKGFSA